MFFFHSLASLGKTSRQQIGDILFIFFFFSERIVLDISSKFSAIDNLHETSGPILWEIKKSISKCLLLLVLPSMLRAKKILD